MPATICRELRSTGAAETEEVVTARRRSAGVGTGRGLYVIKRAVEVTATGHPVHGARREVGAVGRRRHDPCAPAQEQIGHLPPLAAMTPAPRCGLREDSPG